MQEYLNSKDAAAFLGFSEQTMVQSRHTGMLSGVKAPKHLKKGRSVRYKRSDLVEWMEGEQ